MISHNRVLKTNRGFTVECDDIKAYNGSMNIKQSISNDEWRVKIFKALADEKRIAVIRELSRHSRPVHYAMISQLLNTGKSMVSYHLRLLKEAGLIDISRDGQQKFVTLNRKVFEAVLPGFLRTL